MIAIGPYKHFIILEKCVNKKRNNAYIVECKCGRKRKLTEKVLLKYKHLNRCGCPKIIGKESKWYKGYNDISSQYFCSVKHSAKLRQIEFNITIEEVWEIFEKQNKKCALTKQEIDFNPSNSKAIIKQTASIDRIDSKKPYEKSNIQIVHKDINKIKNQYSEQLFKYFCKRVVQHNEQKI